MLNENFRSKIEFRSLFILSFVYLLSIFPLIEIASPVVGYKNRIYCSLAFARKLFYHNSALCPLRHHVTGHPRAHGEQCSQIRVSFYRKAINDFQSASLGNGVDQIFIL